MLVEQRTQGMRAVSNSWLGGVRSCRFEAEAGAVALPRPCRSLSAKCWDTSSAWLDEALLRVSRRNGRRLRMCLFMEYLAGKEDAWWHGLSGA
jgi:hypothetical protein